MTTASSKITSTILHQQFIDCNRGVMPACVATSYPRISNEAYQREYRRDETEPLSEVSSPDTPKYEESYKPQIQCSQPLLYSKKLTEDAPSYLYSAGARKFRNGDSRNSSKIEKNLEKDESTQDCPSSSESCQSAESPKNERAPFCSSNGGVLDLPRQSHSLKTRILQKSDFELKQENQCEDNQTEAISKSFSKKITKFNQEHFEHPQTCDPKSSSEILQKMYVSFGANFGNYHSGLNPFGKLRNMDNADSHFKSLNQHLSEDSSKSLSPRKSFTDQSVQHKVVSPPSNQSQSACKKDLHRTDGSPKTVSPRSKSVKLVSLQKDILSTPRKANLQFESEKSHAKSPKKRKSSADTCSSSNAGSREKHSVSSPVQENKRARYSSSDSTDSQVRHETKDMPNCYKQNGPRYPFPSSLFYPPGPFGMTGSGCNVPAVPGYAQHNPLMFGSNPYLANSLMMREMMSSSGISSLMPFLPHANFSGLSATSGVSPQQLQALHQLQSAMLCQNSFFPGNTYPPSSGIFPFMQNPLLGSGRHPANFNPISADKGSLAKRSPSPESHTSKKLTDSKKLSLPSNDVYPAYANLSRRAHNSVGHQENYSSSGKLSPPAGKVVKQKLHRSSLPATLKRNYSSNTAPHQKNFPPRTSSKKKGEKKAKESIKLKDSNHKVFNHQSSGASAIINAAENQHEGAVKMYNDSSDSPSSDNQSVKSSSYKNLTRERRLVANARERTRVHTISSAFDELRGQIPSYSCNQKLSKLAILRIACEYIRTLSVLVGHDDCISLSQGVDQCTRVLQSESRARSRRKNNKAQIEMEMENYERDRSRDESESRETERQTYSPPHPSYFHSPSPNNHRKAFPSTSMETKSNSENSFVDDVCHDVTDADNDIVDVESVEEDNTNEYKTIVSKNSTPKNHSSKPEHIIPSPTVRKPYPNRIMQPDSETVDVDVE